MVMVRIPRILSGQFERFASVLGFMESIVLNMENVNKNVNNSIFRPDFYCSSDRFVFCYLICLIREEIFFSFIG